MLTYICDFKILFIYVSRINCISTVDFLECFCNLVGKTVRVWGRKTGFRKKAWDKAEMSFPAGGQRGFSCSSAPLPSSWAGTATLEQPPQISAWATGPQKGSWLLWKAAALKFILCLSGLTVETVHVRQMLRIKNTTQILQEAFFFFLREKSILEQNSHTLWCNFTLNFWRKKDFLPCLNAWSSETHWQVVFGLFCVVICTSLVRQDNMWGIVHFLMPKQHLSLLSLAVRGQKIWKNK